MTAYCEKGFLLFSPQIELFFMNKAEIKYFSGSMQIFELYSAPRTLYRPFL
jgi:hypothetical protein